MRVSFSDQIDLDPFHSLFLRQPWLSVSTGNRVSGSSVAENEPALARGMKPRTGEGLQCVSMNLFT